MARYIITVNRAALDQGHEDCAPILVEDTRDGHFEAYSEVTIIGTSSIKYGPERENGATVWIECDDYVAPPGRSNTQEQHDQEKERRGSRATGSDGRRSTNTQKDSET
jgi:hypothetical protein